MATIHGDSPVEGFPSSNSIPISPPGQEPKLAHGVVGPLDEIGLTNQLSFLVEVNAALAAAGDVESVVGSILSRLAARAHLTFSRVYRVNETEDEISEFRAGESGGHAGGVVSLEDLTLLTWVLQHKQEVYVPRVEFDPRCQDWESKKVRSAYIVPLRSGTSLVGVLEVGGDQIEGIRPETRKLVDKVATQIALAFERDEQIKQLQISEERFRSIFEEVSFGIVLARLDGRLSKINPALARLLGSTCPELEGKHFAEVTPPQDAAAIETWLQQLRNGQTSQVSFERRFIRKSGEPLWCAATIRLLQGGPGKSPYFLGMFQDITHRKEGEEEHNRLLQQLFQAQKMEALGTLAGGIAHDFNNLLSVMLGFASLARKRLRADDPLQDSMEMIEESAGRAAELALQLLGFARPEKQPMRPVHVQEVVQRVRRMAERTFDRSVKIEVSVASDPIWVNSEPSYIEQALLNLCLNARDAMPKGGKLSLELGPATITSGGDEPADQNSLPDHVAISVQDTGVGISAEILPRIFEPFFTTKDLGRGTGLGLAMVYGFVKSHSGEVKVESHPGKGTRFTMVLPTVPAPSPQAAIERVKEEPAGGTVLLVDDEPLVRAFASEGLKRLGYDVLVAEDGRQGLEMYAKNAGSIDCVLLDLIMPELTGLETYRRLLALDPHVNVLFASGYSTGEILREAPDAQQASFIGKPYSLENLALTLRETISGQKCCK